MAQSMQCSDSASICHISSKPQSKRVLGAVNLWLPLASLYKTRVFNLRGVVFLSIVFVMMSSSLPHTAVIFRYNLFSFIYLLVLLISTLLPGPTLKSQKGTMYSEILVSLCWPYQCTLSKLREQRFTLLWVLILVRNLLTVKVGSSDINTWSTLPGVGPQALCKLD